MNRSHRAPRAALLFSIASVVALAALQTGCPVHKWDQEVQSWREQQRVPGATTPAEQTAPKSSSPASSANGGATIIPGPASSSSAKPTDTNL